MPNTHEPDERMQSTLSSWRSRCHILLPTMISEVQQGIEAAQKTVLTADADAFSRAIGLDLVPVDLATTKCSNPSSAVAFTPTQS